MTDRTGTPAAAESGPRRTVTGLEPQFCYWHQGPTATPVLITIIEQQSGPGYARFACAACCRRHQLIPYAERRR